MSDSHLPGVLLTGFEPFAGERINPSWETVRELHGEVIAGHRVESRCLPTAFVDAQAALHSALQAHDPAAVIALGQAGSRPQISLERVAINLIDARIPDNTGAQPIDSPVIPGGPAAYFSTLPLKAMLMALRENGIPAEISHTAGTYVCNQVFYVLLHAMREHPEIPAGFVHVPYFPEQALCHPGAPSVSPDFLTQAFRVILRTVLAPSAHRADFSAGRED